MQFFPRISFADTITNSSQAIPDPKVIFLIRPRGIELRTVAPKSMSVKTISSTYCDLPVTLSRPSLRGTDLPTMCSLFIIQQSIRSRSPRELAGMQRLADGIVYDRPRQNGVRSLAAWDRKVLRG